MCGVSLSSGTDPLARVMHAMGVKRDSAPTVVPTPGEESAGLLIRGGKGSLWLRVGSRLVGIAVLAILSLLGYGGWRVYKAIRGDTPAPAVGTFPAPESMWCHPDRGKLVWTPVLVAFARAGSWPAELVPIGENSGQGVMRRTYSVAGSTLEMQQMIDSSDRRGLLRIAPAETMSPCEIMQATGWMGIDSILVKPGVWDLLPPGNLRATTVWNEGRISQVRVYRAP